MCVGWRGDDDRNKGKAEQETGQQTVAGFKPQQRTNKQRECVC